MVDFEVAFGDFMNCKEYDKVEDDLFALARTAFMAGWAASRHEADQAQKIVHFDPPLHTSSLPTPQSKSKDTF